jgi:serine/threonine protein kinase
MQMLRAIEYLQSDEVTICHRDLNPNNIMIEKLESESDDPDQYQYKLTIIDFNVAKRFVDQDNGNPLKLMTNTGTAKYQAPEMLGGWMSSYDQRVDLWSAGAVLYYMLTGGIHAFNF